MKTMLRLQPIEQPSVSAAWAEAFDAAMQEPKGESAPLIVSTTGFDADGVVQNDVTTSGTL